MPWGAAAIIGGAVIGGMATTSAAKTQANAENRATDIANGQYQQTRADAAPFRDASYQALGQIQSGNAPGGQFSKSFSGLGDLSADPGYQFRMDQGMRAVDAGAAARGGVLSGAALKGEQQFGQNYASSEYQNAFNRFQSNQTNAFNRLATVAGLGQTSANTVANAGDANVQAQTAALIGGANARASGMVGTGNAVSNGANSLANWYQQKQLVDKLGTNNSYQYSTGGNGTGGYANSSGNTVANNPSAYTGG